MTLSGFWTKIRSIGRGVKLKEEYGTKITHDEIQKQYLRQVVCDYRNKHLDFKKKTNFDK